MPLLDGFMIVTREAPSFVIPVFVDRPGSNRSLVQKICAQDRVTDFLEIEVGNLYETASDRVSVGIGDHALWGFRSLDCNIDVGIATDLREKLKNRLTQGDYQDFPLIEAQIAKFCVDRPAYSTALAKSLHQIRKRSPIMADIWRDTVVLLPEAKKEFAAAIPLAASENALSSIRVVTDKRTIKVLIPSELMDYCEAQKQMPALTETMNIGHAFGLSSISIVSAGLAHSAKNPTQPTGEVYGEVLSFTGIGDIVLKNAPSGPRRPKILLPPWVSRQDPHMRKRLPFLEICILNMEPSTIETAKQRANGNSAVVRVAIVTLPISFGTRRP